MNRSINGVTGPLAVKRETAKALDYWRDMDRKIKAINDHGLVAFLGYGSYAQMQGLTAARENDLHNMFMYALARYGGMGVSFLITQEYNKMTTSGNPDGTCPAPHTPFQDGGVSTCWYDEATYNGRWSLVNRIGSDLRRFDPYGRALTVHSGVSERDPTPAQLEEPHMYPQNAKTSSWVDFLMVQEGHRRVPNWQTYLDHAHDKAFLESEFNWEGILFYKRSYTNSARDFSRKWTSDETLDVAMLHDSYLCGHKPPLPPLLPAAADTEAVRACMAELMVATALTLLQAGAIGFSYGSQGVYASIVDRQNPGASGDWGLIQTMAEGLQQPGAGRLKFVKKAYVNLLSDWTSLNPMPSRAVLTTDTSRPAGFVTVSGYTSAAAEEYVVHFKMQPIVYEQVSLQVGGANNTSYTVTQINLRNGAESVTESIAESGFIKLPNPNSSLSGVNKNYLIVVKRR